MQQSKLILFSGRDALQASGGGESYAVAHGKAAILAGYEPHVFSIARRAGVLESDFGVVHRIGSRVHARTMLSVLFRRDLVDAVDRFLGPNPGPLILHGYGGWADAAVSGARHLHQRGVQAIPVATVFTTAEHEGRAKLEAQVIRHSPALRARHLLELAWIRAVTARIERDTYRACRAVIVNYQSVGSLLERSFGPGLPIHHLPYAAPAAFHPLPPRDTPPPEPLRGFGDPLAPLIVSTSRHDGRKGLDVLIRALGALRDAGRPFRACLLGTGLLLSAHRRLVRTLGLEGMVLLPGRVPDVLPYLLHADVYVLPSLEEGSGSVSVLEALQVGSAIVASGIDGIPEDLTDGRDALLVRAGDDAELAQTITGLLEDSALRARLATEARRTYQRRFAAPVLASAIAELYTELGLPASAASRLSRIASAT
jgi:glycosyltransferase involved in cell wall biosynthesis